MTKYEILTLAISGFAIVISFVSAVIIIYQSRFTIKVQHKEQAYKIAHEQLSHYYLYLRIVNQSTKPITITKIKLLNCAETINSRYNAVHEKITGVLDRIPQEMTCKTPLYLDSYKADEGYFLLFTESGCINEDLCDGLHKIKIYTSRGNLKKEKKFTFKDVTERPRGRSVK